MEWNKSAEAATSELRALLAVRPGWRVYRYRWLLQRGELVQDMVGDAVVTGQRPTWLFFVDEDPLAFWSHSARLILVAAGGQTAAQQLQISSWPHIVHEIAADELPWVQIDRDDKPAPVPDPGTGDNPPPPHRPPRRFVPRALCQEEAPPKAGRRGEKEQCKKYAIILRGNSKPPDFEGDEPLAVDEDLANNVKGMSGALRAHGFEVNVATNYRDDVSEDIDLPEGYQRKSFCNLIKKLAEIVKCCDEVIIYYTGHGTRKRAAAHKEDATDGFTHYLVIAGGVTATEFKDQLAKIHCCHINVMIDACYAGGFLKPLARLPGVERIHTSSRSDEPSYSGSVDQVMLSNGAIVNDPYGRSQGETGSEFSSGYIEGIKHAPLDASARDIMDKGYDEGIDKDVCALACRLEPKLGTFKRQTHPQGISRAVECDCDGPKKTPRFTERRICR